MSKNALNKIPLLLAVTLSCSLNLYAQKKIKLTNTFGEKHRSTILEEGMRVSYRANSGFNFSKGIIKKIDSTFFVVDDKTIKYKELSYLGRKREGSGFFRASVLVRV